jgi:hypothetical protein
MKNKKLFAGAFTRGFVRGREEKKEVKTMNTANVKGRHE